MNFWASISWLLEGRSDFIEAFYSRELICYLLTMFTNTQIIWPYVGVRYFDLRHWVREISSWNRRPQDSYSNGDFSCDLSGIQARIQAMSWSRPQSVTFLILPQVSFRLYGLHSYETGKLASSTCNLLRNTTVLHVIFHWQQVVHGWNPKTYIFFPHIPSLNYYICILV
jgi:hypothetical protein